MLVRVFAGLRGVGSRQRRLVRVAWAPSLPRRLARDRRVRSVVLIVTLVAAVSFVADQRAIAAGATQEWGTTRSVAVVDRFVPAGGRLSGAVVFEERPVALLPDGAMPSVASQSRSTVDLFPGELLLADRVSGDGDAMPRNTLAITIQIDGAAPLVTGGDLVDVWVTDAANLTSRQVVGAVVVLARHDDQLTIAVPAERVGDVAVAALRPLTVALRP